MLHPVSLCLMVVSSIAVAFGNSAGVVHGSDAASSRPSANIEHGIIYQKPGVYASFPTLTRIGPDRYATEFFTRVRASHVDTAGGQARYSTDDGGRTWQPYADPIVRPHWKTPDGTLIDADADGWIQTTPDRAEALQAAGRTVRTIDDQTIAYLGGAHVRLSDDGGQHWQSRPIELPDDVVSAMKYYPDIAQLKTTQGIRPTAIYGRRQGSKRGEVFFLRSDDEGSSWQVIPMFPNGRGPADPGFDETALVEAHDGTIVAMMRSQPAGLLHRSLSADLGLTWSSPEATDIWGYPCDVLAIDDQRLLCVYGYRRAPMGIRACISDDNGKTWDVANEIILRDDAVGKGADVGYPVVERLSDGGFLVVYYLTTSAESRTPAIAWTRFTLPE